MNESHLPFPQTGRIPSPQNGDNGNGWRSFENRLRMLENQMAGMEKSMLTVKHAFWTVVTVAGGVIVACFSLVAHIILKQI